MRSLGVLLSMLMLGVSNVAISAAGDLVDAIEYYNAPLDHYFVTALPNEIILLDAHHFPGWERTGSSFKVLDSSTAIGGISPVCRFYGFPEAGLDSHFYSASPFECSEVKRRFAASWLLESDNVFMVVLPDLVTGACPSGTAPIFRSWNARRDSNHRYTTDPNVQRMMIARGYIAEGYGPAEMPVAMCAPGTVVSPPSCTVTSSDPAPLVGSNVALFALCDGNAAAFSWTGCASTTSTCVATAATPGYRSYTVVASNGIGPSAPATISIFWAELPPPPVCTVSVTTNGDPPAVGSLAALKASCSGNPTGFQWIGCSSTAATCVVRGGDPGPQTYSVIPRNAGGAGPTASETVNWQTAASPPPGFCSQFPSVLYSRIAWAPVSTYTAAYLDSPGFAGNGAWVVKFTVGAEAAPGTFGYFNVAEFMGLPTNRDTTISSVPCDFRPTDPSGANGPLSRSDGTSTTNTFIIGPPMSGVAGLAPGQTYYLNVRNVVIDTGTLSCPGSQRCDAIVSLIP